MELSQNSSTSWRPRGIYKEIMALCMGEFETLLNLCVFWSCLLRLHCTRLGESPGVLSENKQGFGSLNSHHRDPTPHDSYSLNSLRGGYIGDYIGDY